MITKSQIDAAKGEKKPRLVLKNANVINVFTTAVETCDVAIEEGKIVGLGNYEGEKELDLTGKYLASGFIDGHIHLESSMVMPTEFEKAVVPHGTTAVVTDPHEISNVAGVDGIKFMLEATEKLKMDAYFVLPSCVPATKLDESGAELHAEDLEQFWSEKRVMGLAEVMDYFAVLGCEKDMAAKINGAKIRNKVVDGHAPMLTEKQLNAYICAGIESDHECNNIEEAMEKLKRGQYVMVREGTAAKNLHSLLDLFQEPFCSRAMLATDDKHPGDLLRVGHIDEIVRQAVKWGADPICALKMASFVPAQYFGLKNQGAVAPGYRADLVVFDNLENINVLQVYKDGELIAEHGQMLSETQSQIDKNDYKRIYNSFNIKALSPADFELATSGKKQRVICLTPGELLTTEEVVEFSTDKACSAGVAPSRDIVKLAVLERHKASGHIGLGYLGGYGLKTGAVATSIAHDSHNLIVAGTNDDDMALVSNIVREMGGGIAVVNEGKVLAKLPLAVGGIMSELSLEETDKALELAKETAYQLGVSKTIDPFMTLAFTSLPVIPNLRLITYGLVDVQKQEIVDIFLD